MIQANVHQAKSQLSRLIERAEAGEEVVIARNGKPAVRLTPVSTPSHDRPPAFGALRGQIGFEPGYEAADAEIAAMFEDALSRDEAVPLVLGEP